jgi:hypothetical protein
MAVIRRTTARQLAGRTGISYWRVTRILRQRATPTQRELGILAAALFADHEAAS